MKTNRLNREAVRSTEKADKRITTLAENELRTVAAGEEGCTCAYKYDSTAVTFGTSDGLS